MDEEFGKLYFRQEKFVRRLESFISTQKLNLIRDTGYSRYTDDPRAKRLEHDSNAEINEAIRVAELLLEKSKEAPLLEEKLDVYEWIFGGGRLKTKDELEEESCELLRNLESFAKCVWTPIIIVLMVVVFFAGCVCAAITPAFLFLMGTIEFGLFVFLTGKINNNKHIRYICYKHYPILKKCLEEEVCYKGFENKPQNLCHKKHIYGEDVSKKNKQLIASSKEYINSIKDIY